LIHTPLEVFCLIWLEKNDKLQHQYRNIHDVKLCPTSL
jgi:hypothetical protein